MGYITSMQYFLQTTSYRTRWPPRLFNIGTFIESIPRRHVWWESDAISVNDHNHLDCDVT